MADHSTAELKRKGYHWSRERRRAKTESIAGAEKKGSTVRAGDRVKRRRRDKKAEGNGHKEGSRFKFRILHFTDCIALALYLAFYFTLRPLYSTFPALPLHALVA